jgi:hypothetical protein
MWTATHPKPVADPEFFANEILPVIQELPLSDLVRATGLTAGYLSLIRSGTKVPHARHWPALRSLTERV